MRKRELFTLVGAGLFALGISGPAAHAGTILVFGQSGTSNEFTATNNGAVGSAGGTALSAVDVAITITAISNDVPLPGSFPKAFFNVSASSVSSAVVYGGDIVQDFTGTFSITSAAGGAGTNYLSGSFNDAVFGAGTGLVLTASGETIPGFQSDVMGAMVQPFAMSLSFTNVMPSAFVTTDNTLGAFTSNVSATFSAGGVPEPSSLALLGVGVSFLLAWRVRLLKGRLFLALPRQAQWTRRRM